jgi:hypothetical protein
MKRRHLLKGLGLGATAAILSAPAPAQQTEPAAPTAISPWPAPQLATAGRLGHCRIGNGPAVCVVLHEWLGDHVNWEPTLPYFDLAPHAGFHGPARLRLVAGSERYLYGAGSR